MTDARSRQRVPMDPMRKTALVAGLFYLLTFISIPTLAIYSALKSDPAWILGSGSDTGVLLGTVLELIVALAGIGTAVALFPVVRRQSEGFALGFVTTRIVEAAMIFTGVVSILSLVTLQQGLGAAAGAADAPSLTTTGASLVANYNWAFTVGQSLMPGFNALLLGTLLYRSGLVPRALPTLGLIGAPILITATVLTIFGVVEQYSPLGGLASLPIAVWELSLGLYLTFRGFKATAPIMMAAAAQSGSPDGPASAVRPQVAVTTARCSMTAVHEQTPGSPPRLFVRIAWVLHRALYRFSGGRIGLSRPKAGGRFGMMRLTTVGRRSGQPRVAIVGYYEDGPNLVTLAMNGWADTDPAWWLNLQAQPDTTVELKDGPRAVRGRVAVGAERERLWASFRDYPGWGDDLDALAAQRATERAVVVLEPRTAAAVAG